MSRGMPLYYDNAKRLISDPARSAEETDWEPATNVTKKLWLCLEALRRMSFCLDLGPTVQTDEHRRRYMREFAVPLYEFLRAVENLANCIEGDKNARDRATPEAVKFVRAIRDSFLEEVQLQSGPLRAIRDKISAHIDPKPWSGQARTILNGADLHSFGRWLHSGVSVLHELTKLDIYSWSADGPTPETFRLMACEPIVVILEHSDDESGKLLGTELSESPRRHTPWLRSAEKRRHHCRAALRPTRTPRPQWE